MASNLPPGCTQDECDHAWGGYYDDEPEDDCWHEDYEVDIIMGTATCNFCHFSWDQTEEEIAAECRRIAEYDEWQEREERREWWREKTYPVRCAFYRILNRIWPKRSTIAATDDEIPF